MEASPKSVVTKVHSHPFLVAGGVALLWGLYRLTSAPTAEEILQAQALGASEVDAQTGHALNAVFEGGAAGLIALLGIKVFL